MKKIFKLSAATALICLAAMPLAAQSGKKTTVNNLYGLKIESGDSSVKCRSIPFRAAQPGNRQSSTRKKVGNTETIPVGSPAQTLFLLGMINNGWDYGLAHWGEHSELHENRMDQVQIGTRLGDIDIIYEDGSQDRIPVVIGYTAWFFNQWKFPSHEAGVVIREPFASRPEYMAVLRDALQVREEGEYMDASLAYRGYYLAVTPRSLPIKSIAVTSNPAIRGEVLVSGVTIELPKGAQPASNLFAFGRQSVEREDMQPAFATDKIPAYDSRLKALSDILYTSMADLPEKVELIDFPEGVEAARIRFLSDAVEGDMLSNMWVANLMDMNDKFDSESGFFYETGYKSPFYGGYQGIGTWERVGVYRQAYSRTSDHYVRQALRWIDNRERITSYVDFCDRWLYYFRPDHDPANGPANPEHDISRYPKDAPPHWSFVMNIPEQIPYQMNEIHGTEELEGHSSTIVTKWVAWKLLGSPTGEWLTSPREGVYGKSRWQSMKDATDFICWLMDYTNMDVIYSEGEFTGWASKMAKIPQIPAGMEFETDMVKIRKNYANSDMYEVYASFTSMIALQSVAQMAGIVGEGALAEKYSAYAERIRAAMLRLLPQGSEHDRMWRVARNSVLPSLQDCLVPAWYGLYGEGLDPKRMDPDIKNITNNTVRRQLDQRYGDAPVLAMGYGIGWLTHSALVMDWMDNAGRLLTSIARYTYDKNMDYADPARGIDWRKWMWIIPEGTNIMPDGRWYRICDLGNGANQGPAMTALEMCAGIDDLNSDKLRLLPRIPDPLTGLEVAGYKVFIGRRLSEISYTYRRGESFSLTADTAIPSVDIRFGPYTDKAQADKVMKAVLAGGEAATRWEYSGTYKGKPAIWVWAEGLTNITEYKLDVGGL